MLRNNEYWAIRLQERQDTLFNKTLTQTRSRYVKAYRDALEDTQKDISALYDALLLEAVDGKIKPNDLYRYNRYFALQSELNKRLVSLGEKEIVITDTNLLSMYESVQKLVAEEVKKGLNVNLILDTPNGAKAAVDGIWCYDGAHWSDRLWKQKSALQSRIEKGLLDCVARGVPKDELVKQLNKDFGVGFYCSDRIARTELTYIQNKSAADRYKTNGVKQYKYLAAIDERTSEICKETNGKVFNFSDMTTGVNLPPLHPFADALLFPFFQNNSAKSPIPRVAGQNLLIIYFLFSKIVEQLGGFTMTEIWKDIKGYEGCYQVSNLGRVKSVERLVNNKQGMRTQREKIKQASIKPNGYYQTSLYKNNQGKNYYVHRLVAEAFLENREQLPQVNHKDEDKGNNCIDNLEWCDSSTNNSYGTKGKRQSETFLNNGKTCKRVVKCDLDGNALAVYRSMREAERENNMANGSISAYFRYNRKQSGGFVWLLEGGN